MSLYIQGTGAISPQNTFTGSLTSTEVKEFTGDFVTVQEPDYDEWIDPRAIRRMSKIIRTGVAASLKALRVANLENPDGIITGTSYGCLADTEIFLRKMIENNEEALNPTPFIQSTHNTISGQIALLIKCYGYNQTFTQRGFSFENALLDADLLLSDDPDRKLLLGSIDEIIEVSHRILKKFDLYRKESVSNLELLKEEKEGTINGEGAAYFVVSGRSTENTIAEIADLQTLYKPDKIEITGKLNSILEKNSLSADDIDTIILGKSGDSRFDNFYDDVETVFPSSSFLCYKHLCGEYPTSTSFALWCAAQILKENKIPSIMAEKGNSEVAPKNILIYNHYFGVHHSFILIRK